MYSKERILVLAPHTDDGELGCGGTLHRFYIEGKEVFYAAFSLCNKSLPKGLPPGTLGRECRKATRKLSIPADNVFLYDFEVRNFHSVRQDILEVMVDLNRQVTPDLVLVPSERDIHQDHGVIHQESLRAFRKSSILGYELPWNHADFDARMFFRLSDNDIRRKVLALGCYKSQAHRDYMKEDFTRSLAIVRGLQAGHKFAEAFEVYRILVE
jgi:LmbE family N-acetylglucosaminyl deacetylase